MDAANDTAGRRRTRDLFHLGLAIDREQRDAERESGSDLALFFDRVAVRDAVRRRASGEHGGRLAHRSDIEAAAESGQQLENFRRRIRLDRVEHLSVRQRLGEVLIVVTDHVEIDDQAGSVIGAVLEEFADTCGHRHIAPLSGRRRSRRSEPPATGGVPHARNRLRRRDCCLGPDEGNPVPHCWQRRTSPFGVSGICAGKQTQKSPSVVALSRVARGERAMPVSPPAAGRGSPQSPKLWRAIPNPLRCA